jgi:hypothetical protein
MKKVLALLLSVLVVFGTLSISAFALTEADYEDLYNGTDEVYGLTHEQAILSFNLNGGKIKGGVWVYKNGKFTYVTNYSENVYDMVPNNSKDSKKESQTPGDEITLPPVTAPSDCTFNGWYCYLTQETYPANYKFIVPEAAAGEVVHFMADYTLTVPEEDTMAGVMDILVKVFGTIIGLLFFSDKHGSAAIEEGMQIVEKLIGGLFE